ncbi:MAG: hypothetical protein M3P33_03795 [bacterium]|nr:hypothetical protein [bacterium]
MSKSASLTSLSCEQILRDSGGWIAEHSEFYNGYHGDGWIEKGYIIRNPKLLNEITRRQAAAIKINFPKTNIVIGTSGCGSIVAGYVARHLKLELAITKGQGNQMQFHRMYVPKKEKIACFVDDLIFTGTVVSENVKFLTEFGIQVSGIHCWLNRQSNKILNVDVMHLLESPFKHYPRTDCEQCLSGTNVKFTGVRE